MKSKTHTASSEQKDKKNVSQNAESLSSQTNKAYYQNVYRQIQTTEQLKERLIHMNHKHYRKHRTVTWKAAAIAVVLAAALPASAYAANRFLGIADFFRQSGQPLSEEADRLIETDMKEQTADLPETNAADTDEMPVTFTVREALCDSGSVSIVIEAAAAESGRYLLVPDDCTTPEDSVENIGIHQDISIGEYARSKGLEILYIGNGFAKDSPFSPSVCHFSAKSVQDDTMAVFISADRDAQDTDLNTMITHSIRYDMPEKADRKILYSSSSFKLDDKSSSRTASYCPKTSGTVPGTTASVQKVLMEQTEVFTYVTVFYQNPQGSDMEDGLYFDVSDKDGNIWPLKSGRGMEQAEDGSWCLRLCYESTQLPETFTLKAFDCFDENEYGQVEMIQTD